MTLKIGDVSSYQGNYVVGSNGEDGIIAKVTEGTGYVNPNCDFVLQQAVAKNIPFGGYHFASIGDTPEAQAEYHFAQSKGYFANPNYVDILDFEIGGDATDFITRYVNHLKAISGAKSIWLYGGSRVIAGAKATQSPLWFAGYPYASSAVSPATWITPDFPYDTQGYLLTMWQFTTSGGKFDRSIFYGDVSTWRALSVGGGTGVPVQPVQPAQPVKISAIQAFKNAGNKFIFTKPIKVDAVKFVNNIWQFANLDLAGGAPINWNNNGIPLAIVDRTDGGDNNNVGVGAMVQFKQAYRTGTIDVYDDPTQAVGINYKGYGRIWYSADALANRF